MHERLFACASLSCITHHLSSHVLAELNDLTSLTSWNLGNQSLPGLEIGVIKGTRYCRIIKYGLLASKGESGSIKS